jgi:hypothetical protein
MKLAYAGTVGVVMSAKTGPLNDTGMGFPHKS